MQFLQVGRLLAVHHTPEDCPVGGVHEEYIEEIIPVGDEGQTVALRGKGRTGIIEAPLLAVIGKTPGIVGWLLPSRDVGPVHHPLVLLPPGIELLQPDAQRAAETRLHAPGALDPVQDVADLLLTVLPGDVPPDGLAAAVGEVPVQAVDLGKVLVNGGVAQEHVGIGVPDQRGILRQSLVEPERKLERDVVGDDRLDRAAVEHVVDHRMNQLVVDHVTELPVVSFEGENHPVLEQLGDASNTLFEVFLDHIGLLEGVVGIVDNDRDTVENLIPEQSADRHIRRFRRRRREFGQRLSPLGEIDVEVVRLDVGPVELRVLDLVLAESGVLSGRRRSRQQGDRCECEY